MTTEIRIRRFDSAIAQALALQGLHPLMAQLYAARGMQPQQPLQQGLANLLSPQAMLGIDQAALVLADALESGARIVVVGDYDCDGATATAVAVRGLRMMLQAMGTDTEHSQWQINFVVPDRFVHGYGLSPEVVDLAMQYEPELLVTVDNGIASFQGVAYANTLGVGVVITDHHLPAEGLPEALAIVNPNQNGCAFPSKSIAGVGVMFYVLMALRSELRQRGAFDQTTQPRLDVLLDLVALGTVADVVRLDANNRLLVAQGLKRMRAGAFQPGIGALFDVAGKAARVATAQDLGFTIGPRLNAAGRLADMALGIKLLLAENHGEALDMARTLNDMNRERQKIEAEMKQTAFDDLESFDVSQVRSLVVHNADWHQGVVGLLASRLKERYYLPTLVFAPGDAGQWKGSGRSIAGVHLRDVLDLVAKRMPAGSVPKFGGHAMAAGLTVLDSALPEFKSVFDSVVRELSDETIFARYLETDGSLPAGYCNAQVVNMLNQAVWGQGFAPPMFSDEFEVLNQRILKDAHSKFQLRRNEQHFTALRWNAVEPLPERVVLAYRLEHDYFSGDSSIQLIIEAVGNGERGKFFHG